MTGLKIKLLCAGYGPSAVLRGVDLDIVEGESVAAVRRNGAGKSTLLMSLFQETRVTGGEICVGAARIDKLPGYAAAKLGVAISPQGRRILPNLTVRENLLLGSATGGRGPWGLRAVFDLFPVLEKRARSGGTMLSGGHRVLVVEQHLGLVRRSTDRFIILSKGEIVGAGRTSELDDARNKALM